MNSRIVKVTALVSFLAFLPAWATLSLAAETTGKDVGQNIDETARTIGNYSAEQRDEALKSAKSLLADADKRIEHLENELNQNWDKMSAAARDQARDTLRTLRRQRLDLAERYGELKRSSSKAWEEVKRGFSRSFDELRASFYKAAKEF
ncbi:MAG: hypothetical protein ABI619_05560 [Betaproteobacteria bacterium]